MRWTASLRWPPPHRPILHLVFSGWLAILALIGMKIWREALRSGVLDVRGPALRLSEEPTLYWSAMTAAGAVLLAMSAAALVLALFFLANVIRGRRAR